MKLVFASHNQGKIREAREILADIGVEIASLDDLAIQQDVAETGDSLPANAKLKAAFFSRLAQLPTVGDDSGLEIKVFNDWPGVKSHRIVDGTDEQRIQLVLNKMTAVTNRRAQFRTVLCWLNPEDHHTEFFEGKITGTIATQAQGNSGFGYDPIFIPDGYDQTFAELGMKVKNQISHRRQALEKLKVFLKNIKL